MDVDEYIWRNKITGVSFAKMVQISIPTFRNMKNGIVSPKLVTALKILSVTDGKIDIEELLCQADAEDWKNFIDAN
tara:strand:- start:4777 stop:5004 length:228 start_codon:yes stop_codon:yes gene_type:complete